MIAFQSDAAAIPTGPRAIRVTGAGQSMAQTLPRFGTSSEVLDDGTALTQREVQGLVLRAARRANVQHVGVHVLRHTFCSHLSMKGGAARAIQELAGHRDLVTTQRYMHLTPAAIEATIIVGPARWQHCGNGFARRRKRQ